MLKPLQGVRILEWAIYHAGPGGPAILGDLGAEVIKIEQPKVGDPLRPRIQFGRAYFEFKGRNLFFEGANRNKKSVTLDLSKEEGRQIAYRLVAKSDVFLTNIRNSTVEKMRMTYPILREINPRLIYASISAYGSRGPDSHRGGFDYQGQARSGFMYAVGEPDMPPLLVHFGVIDQTTAFMASHAVLSALVMRERFGVGQHVQISILGSALALLYFNNLVSWLGCGMPRPKRTDTDPLRNYYRCKDGKWICFTLPTLQPGLWSEFCRAIERPDLEKDPRFISFERRLENSRELIAILDDVFATKTQEEWDDILETYGFFSSPVRETSELRYDPQVVENGYVVEFDHPVLGRIPFPGYPVQFSEASAGPQSAAPELGEHTEEVLREIAGYSEEEIREFKEKEII